MFGALEFRGSRRADQTSSATTTMSIEPPSSIDQSPRSRPKTRRSAVEIANSDMIVSLVGTTLLLVSPGSRGKGSTLVNNSAVREILYLGVGWPNRSLCPRGGLSGQKDLPRGPYPG